MFLKFKFLKSFENNGVDIGSWNYFENKCVKGFYYSDVKDRNDVMNIVLVW